MRKSRRKKEEGMLGICFIDSGIRRSWKQTEKGLLGNQPLGRKKVAEEGRKARVLVMHSYPFL